MTGYALDCARTVFNYLTRGVRKKYPNFCISVTPASAQTPDHERIRQVRRAAAAYRRSTPPAAAPAKATGCRCLRLVHAPRESSRSALSSLAGPCPSQKQPAAAVSGGPRIRQSRRPPLVHASRKATAPTVYTSVAAVSNPALLSPVVDCFVPLEQQEKGRYDPCFCFIKLN